MRAAAALALAVALWLVWWAWPQAPRHHSAFDGARASADRQFLAQAARPIASKLNEQGRNYLMQYAAKSAAALQSARGGLTEAEGSFRALTSADRAAARPWTVRTVAYPRGGFTELARSSPVPRAESQLRLMNSAYGGGAEPRVGQLVKVAG